MPVYSPVIHCTFGFATRYDEAGGTSQARTRTIAPRIANTSQNPMRPRTSGGPESVLMAGENARCKSSFSARTTAARFVGMFVTSDVRACHAGLDAPAGAYSFQNDLLASLVASASVRRRSRKSRGSRAIRSRREPARRRHSRTFSMMLFTAKRPASAVNQPVARDSVSSMRTIQILLNDKRRRLIEPDAVSMGSLETPPDKQTTHSHARG